MAEAGVNRISFGVQSFIDNEAKSTGRLHTRAIALEDIERVRKAGIEAINVDLIAGMPGQTIASWRESLVVLTATGVNHASVYMLEVDEDSRLGREIVTGGPRYRAAEVPADDLVADFYTEAVETLNQQGIAQYEISNFASPGSESQHNLKYWKRQPYLGIGVDASSMLTNTAGHAIRFSTTDELEPYLNNPGWAQLSGKNTPTPLSHEEELEEAWFLGLRLNQGVNLAVMREVFGATALHDCEPVLTDLENEGLLTRTTDQVTLTAKGRLLSNEVFTRFLAIPA
jgi:oxygen-independent coproporphyrinogen-3 oxidase